MDVTSTACCQHLLFSYGTLRHSDVQAAVFGGPVPTRPAPAVGYRLVPVQITDPLSWP